MTRPSCRHSSSPCRDSRRWSVGLLLFGLVAGSLAAPVAPPTARAVGSTVTGTVFKDFNSNGVMNTAIDIGVAVDVGVEGVRVRAFDSTGAKVGETLSGADGTYTLTVTGVTGTDVRIEFEIPGGDADLVGLVPSYAPTTATSTSPRSGTSIQFVTIGDTDVNFSVIQPGEYCQSNPKLLTCMFPMGSAAGKTAPGAVLFSSSFRNDPGISDVGYNSASVKATADKLGSVFGIGVDRSGSVSTPANAFIGTYVKRHSEYGDGGATNTIYRLTVPASGSGTVSTFVTLPGTLPAHTQTSTSTQFAGVDYAEDIAIFGDVGRIGLGDVDVTPDGTTLLAVDMDESAPKLYFVPINGTGSSVTAGTPVYTSISKPSTHGGVACPGTFHPMGIGVRGSRILVGGVCGAETTVSTSSPNGADPTQSTAFVLEYTGALDGSGSFSTIFAMNLSYERGCALREDCSNTTSTVGSRNTADWGAWNEYPQLFSKYGKLLSSNPQAMLSNIEIADNGDLILAFRDRYADQQRSNAAAWSDAYDDSYPDPPEAFAKIAEVFSAGDILRVCNSAGTLTLESAGTCSGLAGAESSDPAGGKEFYYDPFPFYGNSQDDATVHPETALGSTATMAGYPGVWSTAYDITWVNQQGVLTFGNCDARVNDSDNCRPLGTTSGYGSRIGGVRFPFSGGGYTWATSASWEKGNGLADLELLCDQAPVQIGNRVWIDTDKDGVQDPGENPVAGVIVHLYNSSGTLVGTAVTNADGEYYFSSSGTEAASGGATPDAYGYGLTTGATFTVAFDDPDNYAYGGPLAGYVMTTKDATTTSTFDLDNLIDSDAALDTDEAEPTFGINQFPAITLSSLSPGTNDHSLDVGFHLSPLVGLGSLAWVDEDGNGIQDAGEPPLAGVTVTLYLPDGVTPVTRPDGTAATATTDADGVYFIDGLMPGLYRAQFSVPAAYGMTTALVGTDGTVDSNPVATTALTATFTIAASAMGDTVADTDSSTTAVFVNPTIDAGFVPIKVSVGDLVWMDLDRDGVQGPGEKGIAGVTLTITKADGSAVTDVFGDPVTTTVTDADGNYSFDDLPPGQYTVTVTPPPGVLATRTGAGTSATDSSDGSATSTSLSIDGERDPSLDFGFYPITVSVGDRVWRDRNGDGLQQSVDKGVAGATLRLFAANGDPARDIYGNLVRPQNTKANGKYLFKNLPAGEYTVRITYPKGMRATTAGRRDREKNSSTNKVASLDLQTDGARDLSLDFGVVGIGAGLGLSLARTK